MVVLVLCTQQLPKLTGGVINAVLNWEVVMMMIQDSRLNKTVFVVTPSVSFYNQILLFRFVQLMMYVVHIMNHIHH